MVTVGPVKNAADDVLAKIQVRPVGDSTVASRRREIQMAAGVDPVALTSGL
jgi:hypothetical protein